MDYESFEQGLRTLASHKAGNETIFGAAEVGLEAVHGQPRPYLKVANHVLRLSDEEAKTSKHIVVDLEKFKSSGSKISMRIEFIKDGDAWSIEQCAPVTSGLATGPHYAAPEPRWPDAKHATKMDAQDVAIKLDNWRVSRLDVLKDNNSIGTLLSGEREYCGTKGIANIAMLHQSAQRQ